VLVLRNGLLATFSAISVSWTFPVCAQQVSLPIIGFLTSGTAASLNKRWIDAFDRGLAQGAYINGKNVKIELRTADDQYARLEELTADLVDRHVSVIVAAGGPVSAIAAKKVTKQVPIVFTTIADPVKSGLVASLNRPGGNITGTAGLTSELDAKRLETLHMLVPNARVMGALINPNRPGVDAQTKELEAAAKNVGLEIVVQSAGTDVAIEDGIVVTADPLFNYHRDHVIALAGRFAIPAIYQWREFVDAGGLISYGPSIADAYYQTGIYVAQILRGAKPADLAVTQPARFELVINLKTAVAQSVLVSPLLLARADQVIE
jgi:putative tryptophan/tyrosine transport system substrate-binding protein